MSQVLKNISQSSKVQEVTVLYTSRKYIYTSDITILAVMELESVKKKEACASLLFLEMK